MKRCVFCGNEHEIRECPFCGNVSSFSVIENHQRGTIQFSVVCNRCKVVGPPAGEENAKASWNRRVEGKC